MNPTMHEIMTHLASGQHGSFARKLAEAWFVGDTNNRWIIEANWVPLINKARSFLIEDAKRDAQVF